MTTYSKETALYDTGAIKNGIDEAATTASKYITYVDQEHGIRVCDGNAENVDVNYTQINSEGMSVHKDSEEVASFGMETRIGSADSANFTLSTDGMSGSNADGDVFFNVDYDSGETTTVTTRVRNMGTTALKSKSGLPTTTDNTYRIDVFKKTVPSDAASISLPNTMCSVALKSSYSYSSLTTHTGYTHYSTSSGVRTYRWSSTINLTYGTPYSETKELLVTYSSSRTIGVVEVINFDGAELTITTYACYDGSNANKHVKLNAMLRFKTSTKAPSFILGTTDGSQQGTYSCAIGENLINTGAHQLVIGKYNASSTHPFVIGNGTESNRKNLFTIRNDGTILSKAFVGFIQMYAGGYNAPSGWAVCDGTEVSREAYSDLFSVIGTTYGAGDGSTTFNLPDFTGRVGIGFGTGTAEHATFHDLGETGGDEDSVVPYHNHSVDSVSIGSSGGHSHTITSHYKTSNAASGTARNTPNTGGSTATNLATIASNTGTHTHSVPSHNTKYAGTSGNTVGANMMPYIGIMYIIYTGVF